MYTKTYSTCLKGIDAENIAIEVDASSGLPGFQIVGLADKSINEAKERITVAMRACDFELLPKRILINLSPAHIKKEGVQLDLAIAVALMNNFGYIDCKPDFLESFILLGELSLTGEIKAIRSLLPLALNKESRHKIFVIPRANTREGQMLQLVKENNDEIYQVANLSEVKSLIETLAQKNKAQSQELELINKTLQNFLVPKVSIESICKTNHKQKEKNFDDVIGQDFAKRAMEVAAAGKHHLLMLGPPGCGKSMLAKRFACLLPKLSITQILDTSKIHSISDSSYTNLITKPPLRAPHHSSSMVSLIGGGASVKPGEVSLAHNGVLFLDELTEFNRYTIEQLRQILEDKSIRVNRIKQSVKFPADFILVAACNPCPCGFLGDDKRVCKCSSQQIAKYLGKLSGPLLDRIDIHLEMQSLSNEEMQKLHCNIDKPKPCNKLSKKMRETVNRAQSFANQNRNTIKLNKEAEEFMNHTIFNLEISARSHQKIIKIARTIANLAESSIIKQEHLAEALRFRSIDWRRYQI